MRGRTAVGATVVLLGLAIAPTAGASPGFTHQPAAAAASSANGSCAPESPSAVVHGPDTDPSSPGTNRRFATGYFNFPQSSGPDQLDSDGDGKPDTIATQPDGSVTITRSDGVVRFHRAGVRLSAAGVGKAPLDGPGPDIAVFQSTGNVGATESYVVPGSIKPGTYDPAAVGVSLGGGIPFTTTDRNGDGVLDLFVIDYEGGDSYAGSTRLVSGAAVVRDAAAGTTLSASATLAEAAGTLNAFGRIDGESPLTGTSAVYRRDGRWITASLSPSAVTLRMVDATGGATVYTTAPDDLVADVGGADVGAVFAWVADDADYLSLTRSTTAGEVTYWWKVDSCALSVTGTSVPPTTAPPATVAPAASDTAPGAMPVDGSPSFTG